MSDNVSQKRIAKNTLLLYIRMLVVTAVNFYAVRLLLEILGVDNYGIYNVVLGLVTMFTMLNGAMNDMLFRYLCYEIGRGRERYIRQSFSISLVLFGALAVLIAVFSESVGLWFVKNKLNVPDGSLPAVCFIYPFVVAIVVLKTLQLPFFSAIVACEKMSFFAGISILEAAGILLSVTGLKYLPYSKLELYAVLQLFFTGLITICFIVYCMCNFYFCRGFAAFRKVRLARMLQFFFWSILGSGAYLVRHQGVILILNIFCGVALNVAWALGSRISDALFQLVGNFQTAFRAPLLKSYADADKTHFIRFISNSSKYSFILIWLIILPLLLETEFFLHIWLKNNIPPYTVIFVQILLMSSLINALNGPLWTAGMADGKVSVFQIVTSAMFAAAPAVSYFGLKYGFSPAFVAVSWLAGNLGIWVFLMFYLKKYGFAVIKYLKFLLPACFLMIIVPGGAFFVLSLYLPRLAALALAALIVNPLLIWTVGLDVTAKEFLLQHIKGRFIK